jgi:hypothetical protein
LPRGELYIHELRWRVEYLVVDDEPTMLGCICRDRCAAALEPCAYAAGGGECCGSDGVAVTFEEDALGEQVTDEIACEARLRDDCVGWGPGVRL